MKVQVFPTSSLAIGTTKTTPSGEPGFILKHNDASNKVLFAVDGGFDRGATLDIQGSLNGTDWVTLVSSINTDRHVLVDLVPYYRYYHNNSLGTAISEVKVIMGN